MKKFSQFLNEATTSVANINGKRLGLLPDGHGGWYDKSGEFVAKNEGGRLKFYNQNQVAGSQDPPQIRTQANQRPVATQVFRKKIKTENVISDYDKILREKYISKEIFNEGDFVKNLNNDLIGKIIRRGTNYLICVTEENKMFKSWIKDVVEYTEVKMDKKMRAKNKPNTLVGTTGYFSNVAEKTPGALGTGSQYLAKGQNPYGINFINKYKINN
jgi:hypothetical protein